MIIVYTEATIAWPHTWDTATTGVSRVDKMQVVFVSGPFRAPTQWGIETNVRHAEEVSLKLWQKGYAVICPHTMTRNFQGAAPDEVWLKGDLELLRRCDAIYMLIGWPHSTGARDEYAEAVVRGMRMYFEAANDLLS